MGLGLGRAESSCFCAEQCPAGTRPFRNYFVSAHALNGPDYGNEHVLFTFVSELGDQCIWQTVVDHFVGPSVETLSRIPLVAPDGFKAWRWQLFLLEGIQQNIWSVDVVFDFPEQGNLVVPEGPASCSRRRWILPYPVFPDLYFATLDAAYAESCDDSDYPEKVIRKPQRPF